MNNWRVDTEVIHAFSRAHEENGAMIADSVTPAVAYAFQSLAEASEAIKGLTNQHYYGRYGNDTVRKLERKIAQLECGEEAIGVASGMAAISSALLGVLQQGNHVIVTSAVYGGTYSFFQSIADPYGISFSYVDCTNMMTIKEAIRKDTKVIYIETPSNPLLTVLDIEAIGKIAKEHGVLLIVDNTFMSPYLQNPLLLGADLVIHSATKYLNGHGDVLAGFIIGDAQIIQSIRKRIVGNLGQNLNAWDAYLILRGLKTLALRMEKHCSNAMEVARFLEQHPMVKNVYYPGLVSHPQFCLSQKQMRGMGGVLSLELKGGIEQATCFIDALKLALISFSLGDAETLVQHPATMTHASIPWEERQQMGVTDQLIRLSIGLENVGDIIDDLAQALQMVKIPASQ